MNAKSIDRFYCFPFLLLFRLLTPVYQAVSRRHLRKRGKQCSRDWKARVVSIGSITVGGSGKTPVVIALAKKYIESGKKVAVVHSGYGRKDNEETLIDYDQGANYAIDQTGDEIAVMASELANIAFGIGRDKKKIVRQVDNKFKPDIIIIDDGYQRLDIEKDLNIAVIDVSILEDNRKCRLFPGGILREPVMALNRADAIFSIDYSRASDLDKNRGYLTSIVADDKIYLWEFTLDKVMHENKEKNITDLIHEKIFLFAGIGSFDRLLRMIKGAELEPAGYYRYGDHYDYDKLDVEHLRGMANEAGADSYLTTAKDMVKLAHLKFDRPLYCLHLKASPVDMARTEVLLNPEVK
jgi:tetraacyldisaccharide 4'-kinase